MRRDFVLQVLADLGFTINTEKSALTPSCSQVHIGYRISTDNPDNQVWISIPKERIRRANDFPFQKKDFSVSPCSEFRFVSASSVFMHQRLLFQKFYYKCQNIQQETSIMELINIKHGFKC